MPAYVLRYCRGKRFAGLYAADSHIDLFYLVSEEDDPRAYDYAQLPRGFGVEFRNGEESIAFEIGKGAEARELAFSRTDGLYMTEGLRHTLDVGKGLIWRLLSRP